MQTIITSPNNPNSPENSRWNIEIPTNNNGLFKKAAPNSNYLIETSYNANDPNFLTGSNYYQIRFGFNPNQNNIKWLGDPFYDWNAINTQAFLANKKQQEWASLNWMENLNSLIDNAYAQQRSLDLIPGVALTANQVKSLKSNILWYEENTITTINPTTKQQVAQKVLIPRLYLAGEALSNLDFLEDEYADNIINNSDKSSLFLANNIKLNTANLTNNAKIIATSSPSHPAKKRS